MNTIEEVPNETNWGQSNGSIKSSTSVTSSSTNITHSTSSTSTGSHQQQQQEDASSSSTTSTSVNGGSSCSSAEELKIIGHLKSIEKINEKRRIFLTNTISEYSTSERTETDTEIEQATATASATETKTSEITLNGKAEHNDIVHTYNEQRTQERKERVDGVASEVDTTPLSSRYVTPTPLKSPMTPPPKPPMLSRTRSFGLADNASPTITSPPVLSPSSAAQSPFGFNVPPTTPVSPAVPTLKVGAEASGTAANKAAPEAIPPITTVAITTTTVPEPIKVTTVQLKEETPVLCRADNPMAAKAETAKADTAKADTAKADTAKADTAKADTAKADTAKADTTKTDTAKAKVSKSDTVPTEAAKPISANHYERLIEELKCPGCAYPMKSPILLCKTGHSICEQCTRVLMLCPLCKEPFTNIRSLTVEALCSKAHFRCSNASGGCTVRLHLDLLGWHEKQCIYKPMKCFMGRVWGDCQWSGREAYWKEHLEQEHANKVFTKDSVDLIWNMGVKQKPLTGYYVFEVFDEMFNFYEVFDKERVLFTMTCTSTVKEKKHNFAFEVTMIHQDNEALAITQKFPVHSEYDSDILMEGTCVSMPLSDLAKFIDDDRLLHYRVRVLEVNSPRKTKTLRHSVPSNNMHPIDFQQTQIEGANLKNVPTDVIVTRKFEELPVADIIATNTPSMVNGSSGAASSSEDELEKVRRRYNRKLTAAQNEDSGSDTDPEFEAFIAKKWGTPQMHFNRKYLKTPSDASSNEDAISQNRHGEFGKFNQKLQTDDRASLASTSTNYRKRMANTLRKSFRSLQRPILEMKPFSKKSPEKKAVN